MANWTWNPRKNAIDTFNKNLESYGYFSLLTLATWNKKLPKQGVPNTQEKKTYALNEIPPMNQTKKSE